MTVREHLEQEIYDEGLYLHYEDAPDKIDGMIIYSHIIINKGMDYKKQNRVIRHELEHYYTCDLNLFEAPVELQHKCECIADRRTVCRLVPLNSLISLYNDGMRSADKIADALEIDEAFLFDALKTYQSIFGYNYQYKGMIINFLPFNIEIEKQ
ncbi:MAG: hypothetical protein ACLVKR_00955 [Lachnospiraceae bacterium]